MKTVTIALCGCERIRRMKSALITVALLLCSAGLVIAQEHPEHPTNKPAPKQAKAYSMDELEKAITAEIQDAQKADGWYHMKDDGQKLVLSDATLHKVDGKARYNWKEKDGYWVRVPAE